MEKRLVGNAVARRSITLLVIRPSNKARMEPKAME